MIDMALTRPKRAALPQALEGVYKRDDMRLQRIFFTFGGELGRKFRTGQAAGTGARL